MKTHYLLLVAVVVIIAGLSVLAINKYEHQPKGLSLSQAVSQRDSALRDLQLQKQLDAVHQTGANNQLTELKGQVTTLTTQKATLCTQIKTARLVQPLCQ